MKSSSNLVLASFIIGLISAYCWNTHAASSTLGGVGIVIGNACSEDGATVFNDSVTHIVVCTGGVWTSYSGGASGDLDDLSDVFVDYTTDFNFILGGNPASTPAALTAGAQQNTFIGHQAGASSANSTNATDRNTAVGFRAISNLTSGSNNTSLGYFSLASNTSGTHNVSIGSQAMQSSSTGSSNVAVGSAAMLFNSGGSNNVAIGRYAITENTVGSSNVAVGNNALRFNTTGNFSVAIGNQALINSSTASSNIAIGNDSLAANTTGSGNVSIGPRTSTSNTTGTSNVSIGQNAGIGNVSGNQNIAIGYRAGYDYPNVGVATGSRNIFIGSETGQKYTIGNDNTFIGSTVGQNTTTGSNNTCVGAGTCNSTTTGARNIVIGNTINLPADTTSDYLLIGTGSAGEAIRGTIGAGNLSAQGAAWAFHSDERMKEGIQTLSNASDNLEKIRGVKFRWKPEFNKDKNYHYGVVAQEVQKVFPEIVTTEKSAKDNMEYLEVAYNGFFAVLIEAFKEVNSKIKSTVADVSGIKKQLTDQAKTIKQQQIQIERLNQKLNLLMKDRANQEKAED